MSAQLFIQPSQLELDPTPGDPLNPGQWARGIPTPGLSAYGLGVPAVGGIADCRNLLADSPPTLLEAYEIYSYSIGWAAVSAYENNQPNLNVELALLVNDRVAYATTVTPLSYAATGALLYVVAAGTFTSDLVNPIRVGARDRLSLRLGLNADQPLGNAVLFVGTQVTAADVDDAIQASVIPYESTISYSTLQLPARRRL